MVIDMVGSSYLLLNLSGPNFKAGVTVSTYHVDVDVDFLLALVLIM
jgi:hypothetical protein